MRVPAMYGKQAAFADSNAHSLSLKWQGAFFWHFNPSSQLPPSSWLMCVRVRWVLHDSSLSLTVLISSVPSSRLEQLYHPHPDVPWQLLPLSEYCCPRAGDADMLLSCSGPSHVMKCVLQYSLWLDDHSTPEVLRGVRAALDACAPAAKGQPGFDDVYPLMLRLSSAQ